MVPRKALEGHSQPSLSMEPMPVHIMFTVAAGKRPQETFCRGPGAATYAQGTYVWRVSGQGQARPPTGQRLEQTHCPGQKSQRGRRHHGWAPMPGFKCRGAFQRKCLSVLYGFSQLISQPHFEESPEGLDD